MGVKLLGWMEDITSDVSMHIHKDNTISQHILHIMGRRMSAETWADWWHTRARWNPFPLYWYNIQRTTEGREVGGRTKLGVRCVLSIVKVNGSY